MIQRGKENAAPSRWAISAKANVWTPEYIPTNNSESALVPRRFKFSQSQPRLNIITSAAESSSESQEGFCVPAAEDDLLQVLKTLSEEWFWLLTIFSTYAGVVYNYSLFLNWWVFFTSLIYLHQQTDCCCLQMFPLTPTQNQFSQIDFNWTVKQRLQTLRGDCETKTETFIHPEQRGGNLHNSGKSQCVFERWWDSKREKTNTWNTKHSVMSKETKASRCTSCTETMEVLRDEEAVRTFSQENTSDLVN